VAGGVGDFGSVYELPRFRSTTITKWKAFSPTDAAGGAGVVLVTIGTAQLSPPLAWVWAGAVLIAFAIFRARREAAAATNQEPKP